MDQLISAAEANRNFSRILREVREGRSFVVTSHGKTVARIVPVSDERAAREAARAALIAWLREQPVSDIGPWTRDELYER